MYVLGVLVPQVESPCNFNYAHQKQTLFLLGATKSSIRIRKILVVVSVTVASCISLSGLSRGSRLCCRGSRLSGSSRLRRRGSLLACCCRSSSSSLFGLLVSTRCLFPYTTLFVLFPMHFILLGKDIIVINKSRCLCTEHWSL